MYMNPSIAAPRHQSRSQAVRPLSFERVPSGNRAAQLLHHHRQPTGTSLSTNKSTSMVAPHSQRQQNQRLSRRSSGGSGSSVGREQQKQQFHQHQQHHNQHEQHQRSSSLSRHPSVHPPPQQQHQRHNSVHALHHFHNSFSSDVDSATSTPSTKVRKEFRDPSSTTGRPVPSKNNPNSSNRSINNGRSHHGDDKMTHKIMEDLNRALESTTGSSAGTAGTASNYSQQQQQQHRDKRIAAITNACAEFDHHDDLQHNIELQNYGAANVLTKLLASAADGEDEIRMVCAATEMVFRAQTTFVHFAFDQCGSVLMPHLLRILELAEQGQIKHADITILNVSKILLYFSRVPELRTKLARNQGILSAIQRVATASTTTTSNKTNYVLNSESRVVRLRIAANLSNCDDNKGFLMERQGFLETILRVAHLDSSDLCREYAGVALMDLCACPANQITMVKDEKLLGTLVKIVLVEKVASARESAITAIQNMAFTKENRTRLVLYKEGIVLEALRKALGSDPNDKARRRAAGALTNLACEETAEVMGSHRGLLDTLAVVATKDEIKEVQTRAAMALTKLAACITIHMEPCHESLWDALVVASLSPNASNSVSAVLRVKSRDPENRESMARHPGVLDTLADICTSPGSDIKDKDNAMRALMHLTNESTNRKVMCSNKKILEALVLCASLEEPHTEDIRDSAIRSMERLATEFSNRPLLARQEGLLVAVAKATEREAKWEENGGGAKTEEPQYAYLAKPLLMSLLVAM